MAADNKKAIKRFRLVILLISFLGVCILGKALDTMLFRADYWRQVSQRFVSDSISVEAMRGNILSADGKVMVASLPKYRLFMDYIIIDKDPCPRKGTVLARLDDSLQGRQHCRRAASNIPRQVEKMVPRPFSRRHEA